MFLFFLCFFLAMFKSNLKHTLKCFGINDLLDSSAVKARKFKLLAGLDVYGWHLFARLNFYSRELHMDRDSSDLSIRYSLSTPGPFKSQHDFGGGNLFAPRTLYRKNLLLFRTHLVQTNEVSGGIFNCQLVKF